MQGLSERQYAERIGLSRGAVQKAKAAGRLVHCADGSIDPVASDARRAEATDPAKQREAPAPAPRPGLKPVPEAALSAVGETLRENGLAAPAPGGGATFLQAKTANEVLKAQERKLRLEGWQVWDLAERMGGQLRAVPGAVIGWDLGAGMALAQALGVDPLVAAEILPEIEAVVVRRLNERMRGESDGAG